CDFVCNCEGCSDERKCGYGQNFLCDFERSLCGWSDRSGPSTAWERRQRHETLPDNAPFSDYTLGTDAGWFVAVQSSSSEHSSVALLESPVMSEAAASCEVRLRYFMWDSGVSEGVLGTALWASVWRLAEGAGGLVWRPGVSSVRGWRDASFFPGRLPRGFILRLHSQHGPHEPGAVAIDQLEFRNCALPDQGPCTEGEVRCARGGCVSSEKLCDGTDDCGDNSDERGELCGEYRKCDFEHGTCEWQQMKMASLKWKLTNQMSLHATFDPMTGPGRDHTTNTDQGNFLYISTAASNESDWTSLESPVLEPTNDTNPCGLVLYYHLFGPRVGGLSVIVMTAEKLYPVLEKGGEYGDLWVKGQVDLVVNTTFQLVLYYHLFGPRVGGLSVIVMTAEKLYPVLEKGGEYGDLWVKGQVDLVVNTTFQIIVMTSLREGQYGGVAVDDLILSPGCRNSQVQNTISTHPSSTSCGEGQFQCASSECVAHTLVCDFKEHCRDGSDEAQCGGTDFKDSSGGWTDRSVGTRQWIHLSWESNSTYGYLMVLPAPGQVSTAARALTPVLGPSGPFCSLRLSYGTLGNTTRPGMLSLNVVEQDRGTRSEVWRYQGNTGGQWLSAMVTIGARERGFQVEVRGHVPDFLAETHLIAINKFEFLTCNISEPDNSRELTCNFEAGLCGWYQDQTDSFDWFLENGSDHTIGPGVSVSVPLWSPSLRGLTGRLLSYPQPTPSTSLCLSFWYQLYGPQTGSLNVKLRSVNDGQELLLWTRSGSHGNTWHHGNCLLTPIPPNFQLVFEAVRDGFDGHVAVDDVMVTESCPTQTSCSFEGWDCGFSSSGYERWVRQNWATGEVTPGPPSDHSLGTDRGYYMIADTSLPSGSVSVLRSEERSAPLWPECVQFWYHKGGDKPGSLRVFLQEVGGGRVQVFADNVSQGNAWRHGNVNISTTRDWQLVFEAEGAGGVQAYIALDDITYIPHTCPGPASVCDFESGQCSWSNTQDPVLDQLDWTLTSADSQSYYPAPPHDHSLLNARGHFLFLPSSQRATAGQTAWLLSPHFPPTTGTCLSFWVHRAVHGETTPCSLPSLLSPLPLLPLLSPVINF
ncbi:AEGP protein, partial [Amia calva]|nr:AEGP protein [Amia calva]